MTPINGRNLATIQRLVAGIACRNPGTPGITDNYSARMGRAPGIAEGYGPINAAPAEGAKAKSPSVGADPQAVSWRFDIKQRFSRIEACRPITIEICKHQPAFFPGSAGALAIACTRAQDDFQVSFRGLAARKLNRANQFVDGGGQSIVHNQLAKRRYSHREQERTDADDQQKFDQRDTTR